MTYNVLVISFLIALSENGADHVLKEAGTGPDHWFVSCHAATFLSFMIGHMSA